MIEQINNVASSWWSWTLSMFWQVGILVALVWCADLIIRKWAWPQLRYALLLMVLVKLVLPPTISLPTSITSGLQPMVSGEKHTQYLGTTPSGTLERFQGTSPEYSADAVAPSGSSERQAAPVLVGGEKVSGPNASPPKPVWQVYAMAVWLAGTLFLGGWLALKLLHLRKEDRKLTATATLPESFYETLARCAKSLGVRRIPKVVLTRKVACPAVFGVIRPVLLVPVGYSSKVTPKDTEHMLLHELAHIKRGDLWAHSFSMILQVVYWYNPLLWLVRRQLHHLRELCCDATIANLLREQTTGYRQTLLTTARRLLASSAGPGLGLLGLFEDSSRLAVRLNWLTKPTWRHRTMKRAAVAVVAAIMLACVLPMARGRVSVANDHPRAAAEAPAEKNAAENGRGEIRGSVVNAVTGEPVADAYVGAGDFGDSGGANRRRHRKQGLFASDRTDSDGRFLLTDLIYTDGSSSLKAHPLVATHPDYVPYRTAVPLSENDPPDVEVRLTPAASLHTRVVDENGALEKGFFLLRLEALDGHLFIPPKRDPHLSAFASSSWTEWTRGDSFTFGQLKEGPYRLDVIEIDPDRTQPPAGFAGPVLPADGTRYHGGINSVDLRAGRETKVEVAPEEFGSRLVLDLPNLEGIGDGRRQHPVASKPFVVISRNPGVLVWSARRFRSLEDARLGRIQKQALLWGLVDSGRSFAIDNLPPGRYAIFTGPVTALQGSKVIIQKDVTVKPQINWAKPKDYSEVRTRGLQNFVKLEKSEYTAGKFCQIISEATEGNPLIEPASSIRNEQIQVGQDTQYNAQIWDILERLYLDKNWSLREEAPNKLLIKPAASE